MAPASSGGGGGAGAGAGVDPLDLEEYKDLVKSGDLRKEAVASLNEICRSLGLPLGGKKDDLVARITDCVGGL